MKKNLKYNVIVMGASCFDGMASSMRVRNLLEPLINVDSISAHNIIYEKDNYGLKEFKGKVNKINYVVIGFKITHIFTLFQFLWKGLNFIKTNKSRYEKNIIYNYEYPDIKNIIFLLYARLIGYKIIFDIVEDNRYYEKFGSLLNRFKIMSSILFLKITPFIAHTVLAISSHLYDLMSISTKGKIPVYLVPITVDLSQFTNKSYNISNEYKVLYGGSFGEKDGLEYLLKAFEQVSLVFGNIQLLLAGRPSNADYKKLLYFIEKSPCKDKIVYIGFLNPYDYYDLINKCDILCMTRIDSKFANGGFPYKLGEYLSSGKAVIATNISDVSKYLTNYKDALIVKPNSVDEIAKSLTYLLENPERIISLGEQARKVAEQNFDNLLWSKRLLKILEKI